ncbi:hypothetical protein [Nitratireductor sp. ZSWI3]|uniref:hypothetical protein n=1 Tax=Nitratireductor sp. ZSWI3 TaxID=2966359 RepID=UPI00215022D1|nr:hypothetical protein [Nitratireductor sp. ZSWI3]MCR4264863.1 hypothetical protein [Nitratireductor sp. ZSWI3]
MAVHLRRKGATLSLVVAEPAERNDGARYIEALEEIAGETAPFALLVAFDGRLDLDHEHRRAQNLWFKATRGKMNATCRAVAVLRENPTPEMQRTFSGLWTFPVLVTRSRAEAETFLATHLPAGRTS